MDTSLATLLISLGLIAAGLFLAWKWHALRKSRAQNRQDALNQLLSAKAKKDYSSVAGDSRQMAGKKGIFQ